MSQIESQEIVHLPHCSDGSMPTNWAIAEYWDLIHTALAKGNVNFASAPLLAQKMTAAGFTNVTQQILHVPIGPWARNRLLKLVGLYWRTVLYDGASPIALRPLTRELGWTMQEGTSMSLSKKIYFLRIFTTAPIPVPCAWEC